MRRLILFLLLVAANAHAGTFYVNPEGSGPYPTIQSAIDAAVDGDEVVLAEGIYLGDGNRDIRYHGKAIHVGSLSGDPVTVQICPQSEDGDIHHSFIFDGGEGAGSVLEGVELIGGHIGGKDDSQGALMIQGASPKFRNVYFRDTWGTAVHARDGAPLFERCYWINNTCQTCTPALDATAATLVECQMEYNRNDDSVGSAAIGLAHISKSLIRETTTKGFCGALWVGPGSVIEDSSISGHAEWGAALCVTGPVTLRRCWLSAQGYVGSDLHVWSGCVILQETSAKASPSNACVRRVKSDTPASPEPLALAPETWGRIKATYK